MRDEQIQSPYFIMLIKFTSYPDDSGTETPSTANDTDEPTSARPPRERGAGDPPDLDDNEKAPSDNYIKYDRDWYQPGNHFAIWAPQDLEIHQKRFILLDTKNSGGTGLLVEVLQDMNDLRQLNKDRYADLKNMVLTCCETRDHAKNSKHEEERNKSVANKAQSDLLDGLTKRMGKVHMYEQHESKEQSVALGSFIRLAHVYHISYHWMIEDLGAVSRQSLQELRYARMRWEARYWDLEDRVKVRTWVEGTPHSHHSEQHKSSKSG